MDTKNLKAGTAVIFNKRSDAVGDDPRGLVDGEKYSFIKRICGEETNHTCHVLIEKDNGEIHAVKENELNPTLLNRFLPDWIPL